MTFWGRELKIGTLGEFVRQLHRSLARLGADVPPAERRHAVFGEGTRVVVVDIQRRFGIDPTGIVDEQTAAAILQSMQDTRPASGFRVTGRVRYSDGRPFTAGVVRAFDRDLRAEQVLNDADATLDAEGRYEIAYSPSRFCRAEKDGADLVVRAYSHGSSEPIAVSPVFFNASPDGVVDLMMDPTVYAGPSEFEQMLLELLPLLGKVPVSDLRDDDIVFLSGETGIASTRLALFVIAHRLRDETDVPAEVFYGLFRQSMPTPLPQLLVQSPEAQQRALVRSADSHIIPAQFGRDADGFVDRLKELIVGEALKQGGNNGDGAASVRDLLGLALEQPELQARVLSEYVDHAGPIADFWKRLADIPALSDHVRDLQLTVQLGALTRNHPPLVRELQRRLRSDGDAVAGVGAAHAWFGPFANLLRRIERGSERSRLVPLASLAENDWLQIITANGDGGRIGAPPGVPGKVQDERERNYAKALARMVEDTFPTAFVTERLRNDNLPGRDHLLTFLTANPEFDIRTTRLDRYVADHPDAFRGIAEVEAASAHIKAFQRVYKLAPRYEHVALLLNDGLDSAHRITRMGRNAFRRLYARPMGGSTHADSVYGNASVARETALTLAVDQAPLVGRIGLNVLPDEPVTQVEGVPEWSSLFGSVELCDCEHCRSIHGPAAYFVDILKFLSERDSQATNLSVKDILFARRPDLGDIELTCDNTNTPLPYVDLVNEALENAVTPPAAFVPFVAPAAVEADLNARQLSAALRNAFNPALSTEATITAGAYGKPWAVDPGWWTIDEPAFTYTVQQDRDTGELRVVRRGLQTRGTASERVATPQYINAGAYRRLSRAVHPSTLPFSLWWEEANVYLGYLGTPRHLVMERLGSPDRAAVLQDVAVACEYLGLSLETERDQAGNPVASRGTVPIITGVTTSDPDAANPGLWNLWGFATQVLDVQNSIPDPSDRTRRIAGGNWLDVLRGRVDVFLQQSGLSYKEMLDLLDTYYVNPAAGNARVIQIVSTDPQSPDTCETRRLRLNGFDQAAAARTLRFVRLWRALGWSMRDLDRAITAFGPANFDDLNVGAAGARQNERFLVQLSHLQRLHRMLDVPVVRLLSWWADLDTRFYIDHTADGHPRAASLYDELFRNRSTINPPDPAFTEDPASLAGTLTAHAAAIAAALAINGADFARLLADANLLPRDPVDITRPDDRLTLAYLSRLHRHASLAKALRMPIREYLAIRRLTAVDPFATTTDTVVFAERVDEVRNTGASASELEYLLRHAFTPDSTAEQTIPVTLTEIRNGLAAIARESTFRESSAQAAPRGADVDPIDPTTDLTGDLTRQKLALLNWDANWVNAAVATLGGAVIYEAPLAALPQGFILPNPAGAYAAGLAALPAAFVVPAELDGVVSYDGAQAALVATRVLGDAERVALRQAAVATADAPLVNAVDALFRQQDELAGEITHDAPRVVLRFAGPMSDVRRQRLRDALPGDVAYLNAVQDLYDQPRRFIGREMRAFRVHDFAEPLAAFPASVRIPAPIKQKFYFDAAAATLHASGVMSEQERATLLALSTVPADPNHAAYSAAVNGLYYQAAALVPAPGDTFLTTAGVNNDADALFAVSRSAGDRFLHVLRRLLPYLRRTLSEQFVIEKTADALQLETRMASELLRTRLASPTHPLRSCLDELLDPAFADSSPNVTVAAAVFPRQFRTFVRLQKTAFVISTFALTHRQLGWLFDHGRGAGWLDPNALPTDAQDPPAPLEGWRRLAEMALLRDQLSQGEMALHEILTRAAAVNPAAPAADRDAGKRAWFEAVTRWTRWTPVDLEAVVGAAGDHANTGLLNAAFPGDYIGVGLLVRLQRAFDLLNRLGMPAALAADIAARDITQAVARSVRQTVRAKYDEAQWLVLAKPLHDGLREKRRAALVAYLMGRLRTRITQLEAPHPVLAYAAANPVTRPAVRELQLKLNAAGARPALRVDGTFREDTRDALLMFQQTHGLALTGTATAATWAALDQVRTGSRDANDLYSHFLIDVEMSPCMATSRIKQAIGSVQQFVQRCLMNLEPDVSANAAADEKWRGWNWMKQYRVWEANRKIFLYPENWIEPELRDDKSPFFKELESELLQSDLTEHSAEDAFLHYLEKLDQVARLEIVAMYHELEEQSGRTAVDVLHVFGRTYGAPRVYFYRCRIDSTYWTPWERLDLDIEGDHLIPVVWNRRLMLFWPVFTERARPLTVQFTGTSLTGTDPVKYWEMRLAWSEHRPDGWSNRRLTSAFIELDQSMVVSTNRIMFRTLIDDRLNLHVLAYYVALVPHIEQPGDPDPIGGFPPDSVPTLAGLRFDGCHSDASISEFTLQSFEVAGHEIDVLWYTEGYYMHNRELYRDALYLPAPAYSTALDQTPGTFHVLRYADGSSLTTHPFFFHDERRTFLVTPSAAPEKPTIGVPELADDADLGLVVDVAVPYWEEVQELLEPGMPPDPDDPLINDPSFPVNGNGRVGRLGDALAVGNGGAIGDGGALVANGRGTRSSRAYYRLYNHRTATTFRFHTFYHPYVCTFIRELNRNGVDGLLQRQMQLNPHQFTERPLDPPFDFRLTYQPDTPAIPIVTEPYPIEDVDFDDGAYAQYNWELFFHVPLLIADRLGRNQRYEEAQKWFHFIFDPTDASGLEGPARYWRTRPFYERTREEHQRDRIGYILRVLASAADPQTQSQLTAEEQQDLVKFQALVAQWRRNPFKPHLIARLRTTAYQKAVVMKYLDNLIAWGDQLFRRDTIESNNEATQLYILAAEILGRRPEDIPARATPRVQTYNSLEPRLDDLSNALVEIEEFIPPSSGGPLRPSWLPSPSIPGVPYFCISRNEKLLGYWDTVADRLFKLRHCLNIEGVARQLPLFEPPIDPSLLVRAAAAGVDLGSVLNDFAAPSPHYRFVVLARKASEVCSELKSLGQAMLAALEKQDAERLALVRAEQEAALLDLVDEVRMLQVDEAEQNKTALSRSRDAAVTRYLHFQKLLGVQSPQVPPVGQPIADASPSSHVAIQEQGGIKMIPFEQGEMDKLKESDDSQDKAAWWGIAASIAHAVPNFNLEPWGIGATFGGSNVGSALSAVADRFHADATESGYEAGKAARMGQFALRAHDWLLQRNAAAREIVQIDQQFITAELRGQIAAKELANHRRQREDARATEDLLRDKYTNQELYGWMIGQLSTIYFQTYQLTYDLAKRVERAFRRELGLTDSNFIQFGYWDGLKKGLLAGDRLYHDLKRLEVAYFDRNRRELEITRHVSLRQLDPLALVQLRQTGGCAITLPETLFDLDYPGHYLRRVKSVSVTVPCVTGPYTGVNCTLTLLQGTVRHANTLLNGRYTRQEGDPRFTDSIGAIESVATSSGQNDSGLFETNLNDERYLPFEGAGLVDSRWQIDLPGTFRQFDYDTIADVVLHVRYTARDAGGLLRQQASLELQDALNAFVRVNGDRGLTQFFSIRHEFPTEWHRFLHPANAADGHTMTLGLASDRFPLLVQRRPITVDSLEAFVKVRPGFRATHNDATLRAVIGAGNAAPTAAAHQPNDLLPWSSWNGLLRGERAFAQAPGAWTINAWLDDGGGPVALDPDAIEDVFLLAHYTVG